MFICEFLYPVLIFFFFVFSVFSSFFFFFASRRRHTRCLSDWSSDVCSSDLLRQLTRNPVRVGVSFPHLQEDVLTGAGGSETELFLDAEVFGLNTQGAARERLSVGARRLKQIGRASCRESVRRTEWV